LHRVGDGTIFELVQQQSGWDEETIHTFDGDDGKYPYGAVVFDPYGNLFATTFWGGNFDCNSPPQVRRSLISDRPNLSRDSAQPILPPSKCQPVYGIVIRQGRTQSDDLRQQSAFS
jgi:hypothetical protein